MLHKCSNIIWKWDCDYEEEDIWEFVVIFVMYIGSKWLIIFIERMYLINNCCCF